MFYVAAWIDADGETHTLPAEYLTIEDALSAAKAARRAGGGYYCAACEKIFFYASPARMAALVLAERRIVC